MSISMTRVLHPSGSRLPTQQGASPGGLALHLEGPLGNLSPDRAKPFAKLQNETAQGKEHPSQNKGTRPASQQLFAKSL